MLDVLVIGGGLSGCLLAWRLRQAGHRILVLDAVQGPLAPAWAVAAGLAAPVTGQRATLLPQAAETLRGALDLYATLANDLGQTFWRPRSIVRCFFDKDEALRWQKRCGESDFVPYLRPLSLKTLAEGPSLQPVVAAFEILGGGHLNINALVPAMQSQFFARGELKKSLFLTSDFSVHENHVQWRDIQARHAIFCEGVGARHNSLFPPLPFHTTRGELLELDIPGLHSERVFYGRHFLIPLGDDHYLCGATYDRQDLISDSSAAGRAELENGLQALLRIPYKVTGQRCGLRPNVRGHEALWQRHPTQPRLWRLNGLGSKGAWSAPGLTLRASQEIGSALSA